MPPATGVGIKGQVLNGDCYGLYLRMIRFLEELWKSSSSSVPYMSNADQARLAKYLNSIDAYITWFQAEPELDLPETSPKAYDLPAKPAWTRVESDDVDDLLRQFDDAITELVNSQSARNPCRMIPYDEVRVRAYIQKMRRFLIDYIAVVQPVDLPESSPRDTVSGPGQGGV